MGGLFLGKPLHWAALVAAAIGLAAVGDARLHVTGFNVFIALVGLVAVVLVALVLTTSSATERVTRDPIPAPEDD